MAKHRTPAVLLYLGLAATLLPTLVRAGTSDGEFDCNSSPHEFISSLIDAKSIDPQPVHVKADSVNAFRPTHGAGLQAFGFPVYRVFGYERDDALFRHGDGKTIDSSVYGVVVSAPADPVRKRVEQTNSHASVQQIVPLLLTAIICDSAAAATPASER